MKNRMRNFMFGVLLLATQAHASTTQNLNKKSDDVSIGSLPQNTAQLVFVRLDANPNPDTSTNLSINGRYLTSLQDGYHAVAAVCAGKTLLSAMPTLALTNDLTANSFEIALANGQNQTLLVEIDQDSKPVLRAIDPAQSQTLLAKTHRQAIHVSRIFAKDCNNQKTNSQMQPKMHIVY